MDKSIVAEEESHRRSDFAASASKSLGSLVQIDSIAIDISCAMEEFEPPAHDHFSIRGYVAGMRKKDRKTCLPFASEGDDHALGDNLPPLSVPIFRWWQCSNCVPEMLRADKSGAGTSSCQNVGGEKDDLFSHSKQYIGDEHGSRDSRDGEDSGPSNKIIKYNPWCTEGHKVTTCSKGKNDVRNSEGGNPCAHMTETNPFHRRERHNDDADAPDMGCIADNPTVVDEPENASSGRDGAFSALPHRRKPKLRSLADIMEEEKNLTSEHPRTRSASAEIEADLDPELGLDAPLDVAKCTRSPSRKRKTAIEEDRVSLEMSHPIGTAKRSKGPIPDAEKICRKVVISDIESDGDASTQLDSQVSAKNQQIKPKKSKAPDISRKMRRTHADNRTIPMREVPKINSLHSANLEKHAVASETYFSNSGGEMGPYFKSFLSGQKVDRVSDLSMRSEVEADHSSLMPLRKSIIGDCVVHGKVALDLSLNSCMDAERNSDNQASLQQRRVIPDLNESFTEKTSVRQGKQLPNLSDNRSFTLHKNLDMSASCSKEMAREGKRQLGVSEPQQPFQNMDKHVEHGGASDDIPMEIVELLAMNQRERALGNPMKHLLPQGINNSIRGSPPVYMDGRSMTGFPFTNVVNVANGKHMEVSQGLNFPPLKNSQFGLGNLEGNQFRLFDSYKPSQQRKTQYMGSNSIMSGPRPNEGADLLWPPRRKNVPFHISATETHSIQPNGMGVNSFSDKSYKGKTMIGDIKGPEKKALHLKEGRMGSSSKSVGSLDAYSNDAIPAMQLLSLMERGTVPVSSVKVGPNSFLDKPFSPCNHHPRLNGNEKHNDPFRGASFFSQSSHSKDFPSLLNGVCFPGSSLKKSYLQGHMPPQQGNSKASHLEGRSNLVIQPQRGNLALDVCTLNRNPADFSIPDARNEYTISAKDLKPRKRNSLKKDKSHPANVEGQKKQRMRKDASAKELSRK